MNVDPKIQATVKDASNVLVGVAQVRVAGFYDNPYINYSPNFVIPAGKSDRLLSTVDPSVEVVSPVKGLAYFANTRTTTPSISTSGLYTGDVSGVFIFRATRNTLTTNEYADIYSGGPHQYATNIQVFCPDGTKGHTTSNLNLSTTLTGLTISVDFTGAVVGDTWILPVWAATPFGSQTGIVSPYSMFSGAFNSVGGLKDSAWNCKTTAIDLQEAGTPTGINNKLVLGTTISFSFSAYEYDNVILKRLRTVQEATLRTGVVQAFPAEMVFRTRGGTVVTHWCPSCTIAEAPNLATQNDYYTGNWVLNVNDQTATGATGTYATWLKESQKYYELQYLH